MPTILILILMMVCFSFGTSVKEGFSETSQTTHQSAQLLTELLQRRPYPYREANGLQKRSQEGGKWNRNL
jgi:hypothetical protein